VVLDIHRKQRLSQRELSFILGAVLALSLFLVEAGVAEILIGNDSACRQSLSRIRLAPDAFSACQPEWVWFMLRSLSRGWAWLANPELVPVVGWLVMGLYYAVLGGMSQQLSRRSGWVIFLGLQLATVAVVAGLSYLGQFIA
jgi:hypothetical protein